MKLTDKVIIPKEKFTKYLLVFKKRNDKSQWLAKAGYKAGNWKILENDLKKQILRNDASYIEDTPYGQLYEIRGNLLGPNNNSIAICTIWLIESETGNTKFITMYPDKKEQ
ncbi:MAG: hypothetical protein PF693_05830 [Spirochaetia bacterium]|jgi:hypothetical protein|nr:hypothetical protein [Spirochaetia bacterium]